MPDTRSQNVRHRMRRWMYAPMIAALAAGAMASGASIGSADTNPDGVGVESNGATVDYAWRVHNFTDQTLTAGDFHRDQGEEYGSALNFGGETPWPALRPGDHVGAYQPSGPPTNAVRTWGKVCYAGQIWNMPRTRTDGRFWNDMYVFAMDNGSGGKKLMITPEGGKYDIDMNTSGETC